MTHFPYSTTFLLALTVVAGIWTYPLLDHAGYLVGVDGVRYYAEVHQSEHNSWIHTFFMLGTVYGASCWVPAVFGMVLGKWYNGYHKKRTQWIVWTWYLTHYAMFDPTVALATALWYSITGITRAAQTKVSTGGSCIGRCLTKSTCQKYQHPQPLSNLRLFVHGFCWMWGSLLIQESFGHWYGGDNPSRPEGVPNAILYASAYTMWHAIRGIPVPSEQLQCEAFELYDMCPASDLYQEPEVFSRPHMKYDVPNLYATCSTADVFEDLVIMDYPRGGYDVPDVDDPMFEFLNDGAF